MHEFENPNSHQIPVTSNNHGLVSGNFVSGADDGKFDSSATQNNGEFDSGTYVSGNDFSTGQFSGFGLKKEPNNGKFASGTFVSGFGPKDVGVPGIELGRPQVHTISIQQYYSCLRMCFTSNEYNPVCGSDGQNYHNVGRLECSQQCGSSEFIVRLK